LESLPPEVIEEIAESLSFGTTVHLDGCNPVDMYFEDAFTDVSAARLDLSSFSQVCFAVREPVERILYRNIQLDFSGWTGFGTNHSPSLAGCLRLFLRTLDERPQLGRFVRSAALDWNSRSRMLDPIEEGLVIFMKHCSNLQRLLIARLPDDEVLEKFDHHSLVTLGTIYWQRPIATLLTNFPNLQNLCVNYPALNHFSEQIPPHNLTTLTLVINGENPTLCLARVLDLCGTTVRDLSLTLADKASYSDYLPSLSSDAGAGLQTIRLRDFDILQSPESGVTQLLLQLPAQRIDVGHFLLPSSRVDLNLPIRHLQSMRLWLYFPHVDRPSSVSSLTQNVLLPITMRRRTAHIELQSRGLNNQGRDLSPLLALCEEADIALTCIDNEWYRNYFVVDIFFSVSLVSVMGTTIDLTNSMLPGTAGTLDRARLHCMSGSRLTRE
jgi:hypothetical protein